MIYKSQKQFFSILMNNESVYNLEHSALCQQLLFIIIIIIKFILLTALPSIQLI